jgi:hypothetical protein
VSPRAIASRRCPARTPPAPVVGYRDHWFTAPEAVAYGLADEVIDGAAGVPESATPA